MRAIRTWLSLRIVILLGLALVVAACGDTNGETAQDPADDPDPPAEDDGAEEDPEDTAEAEDEPEETYTWRVGRLVPDADAGFMKMDEVIDFHSEYNLELEVVEVSDTAGMISALISGEVDSVEHGPSSYMIAAEAGDLDVRIFGAIMPGLPYAIFAREGIESMEDLPGATFAISSDVAVPALVAREMMRSSGVDPDSVTYVNAGGNQDRYRAVVAGTADAAVSPSDFVPQAEEDGMNILGYAHDLAPNFPRYFMISTAQTLEANPEAAARYVAGKVDSVAYALENPEEIPDATAQLTDREADDPVVQYLTQEILDQGHMSPDGRPPRDKLEWNFNHLVEIGELQSMPDLDTVIDESYLDRADELRAGQG